MSAVHTLTRQAVATLIRERTVALVAALFAVLVLVSAYLGWSATATVNAIYADAAAYLATTNQPVPPNPVTEGSPLALLRNLSIYVSLIGAFAAIVIGQGLVEADRRAGVLPLIGARPLGRLDYALGKSAPLRSPPGRSRSWRRW